MQERKTMEFGRRYQVGNYTVMKRVRALNKRELGILRTQAGIPADVQKHLQRGGLPYIIVETVSGSWSMFWVCGLAAYAMIDRMLPLAVEHEEDPSDGYEGMTVADFAHLFNMWYTDTNVMGDEEYQKAKAEAFRAYMERLEASREETPEEKAEDDKVLEGLRADEEAKATIVDMAEQIREGGDV